MTQINFKLRYEHWENQEMPSGVIQKHLVGLWAACKPEAEIKLRYISALGPAVNAKETGLDGESDSYASRRCGVIHQR